MVPEGEMFLWCQMDIEYHISLAPTMKCKKVIFLIYKCHDSDTTCNKTFRVRRILNPNTMYGNPYLHMNNVKAIIRILFDEVFKNFKLH